jgi:hypothetical protein
MFVGCCTEHAVSAVTACWSTSCLQRSCS